jgi:hypothetical protein
LVDAAIAISTLAGCASFRGSFGEITDLFGPRAEQPLQSSDATVTAHSPNPRVEQKNLVMKHKSSYESHGAAQIQAISSGFCDQC